MPTYEYCCQNCEKKFEIEATVKEKESGLKATCPECHSNKTTQVFGNFFIINKSKKKGPDSCNGCDRNSTPGCCG